MIGRQQQHNAHCQYVEQIHKIRCLALFVSRRSLTHKNIPISICIHIIWALQSFSIALAVAAFRLNGYFSRVYEIRLSFGAENMKYIVTVEWYGMAWHGNGYK